MRNEAIPHLILDKNIPQHHYEIRAFDKEKREYKTIFHGDMRFFHAMVAVALFKNQQYQVELVVDIDDYLNGKYRDIEEVITKAEKTD